MVSLFNAIQKAFDASGWAFEVVSGREVIETSFDAHHTRIPVHVQCFEPIGCVHVVSTSSHVFQPYHRLKVAELLLRSSQIMTLGNFEYSWDQGQVLYRATNLFDMEQSFPDKVLQSMVHAAVAEMDRMTPQLAEIAKTTSVEVARIDVAHLMLREDWIPPVPEPEAETP